MNYGKKTNVFEKFINYIKGKTHSKTPSKDNSEVPDYIRETHSEDISGNINHYDFPLAPNAEILLDKKCYERLLELTNISALHTDEHNTFLFGLELKPNQIYFSIPDESRDYDSSTASVDSGKNQLKEVVEMIKNHPYANTLVICNLHTHPFGILKNQDCSPSLQNNFFSGLDLDGEQTFKNDVKRVAKKYEKNADAMAGLIAIDNNHGNSMISFAYYTGKEFLRFNNVKVVEMQPDGQLAVIKDLNEDGFDYIEKNFGLEQ